MPVILLGGIYSGVTTPTEAAAVAAAYAFLIVGAVLYRSITLARHLPLGAQQRAHDRLDRHADRRRAGLQLRGHGREHPATRARPADRLRAVADRVPVLVNVILLVLGCLLEGTTILLVIVPVLIPTAQALGIDLVHFGVVVVVNIMIGLVTPPYGLLLFIMINDRRGAAARHRARRRCRSCAR